MFTLIMLICHTIADFVLQTNEIVKWKSGSMEEKIKGFYYHGLGIVVTSLCLLIVFQPSQIFEIVECSIAIIIIIVLHIVIDFVKEILYEKAKKADKKAKETDKKILISIEQTNLLLFIFDQILHIIVIMTVTRDISITSSRLDYNQLKTIFITLYIALSGAYLIPLILDVVYSGIDYTKVLKNRQIKLNQDDEEAIKIIKNVKTGKWIGILERTLITIFLFINEIGAIGFIIAIKSLARFKMMDDKIFSEYYLLGTLLSVVYSFCVFIIANHLT